MLAKIIKYEWKSTARILIPVQIIVLILSLLARFQVQPVLSTSYRYYSTFGRVSGALSSTIIIAYLLVLVLANAFTFIYLLISYYKSMFKDAGYLTHTLPVATPTILCGKFIMNFIWVLLSIIIGYVSMLIAFWSGSFIGFMSEVVNTVVSESRYWAHSFAWYIIIGILILLSVIAAAILEFYFCMNVAQLAKKHHLLAGVGAFFIIYIVKRVVNNIFLSFYGGLGVLLFESSMDELLDKTYVTVLVEHFAVIVICYILSRIILTRKLNIE